MQATLEQEKPLIKATASRYMVHKYRGVGLKHITVEFFADTWKPTIKRLGRKGKGKG